MFWGLFLSGFDLSPGVRVPFGVGVINAFLGGGGGYTRWVVGGNCLVENNRVRFSVISVGMGICGRPKRVVGICVHGKVAGSGGDDVGMFFHVRLKIKHLCRGRVSVVVVGAGAVGVVGLVCGIILAIGVGCCVGSIAVVGSVSEVVVVSVGSGSDSSNSVLGGVGLVRTIWPVVSVAVDGNVGHGIGVMLSRVIGMS